VKHIIVGLLLIISFVVFRPAAYDVVGTSMEPTISSGDTVIIARGIYKEGDIIVFYWPEYDQRVIHRIHAIDEDGYTAWGDNNPIPDDIVITDCLIIGKMLLKF